MLGRELVGSLEVGIDDLTSRGALQRTEIAGLMAAPASSCTIAPTGVHTDSVVNLEHPITLAYCWHSDRITRIGGNSARAPGQRRKIHDRSRRRGLSTERSRRGLRAIPELDGRASDIRIRGGRRYHPALRIGTILPPRAALRIGGTAEPRRGAGRCGRRWLRLDRR
jgi:hypothetical protein